MEADFDELSTITNPRKHQSPSLGTIDAWSGSAAVSQPRSSAGLRRPETYQSCARRNINFSSPRRKIMTLCPIALVVGCKKCPVFALCPLKTIIGDQGGKTESGPTEADSSAKGTVDQQSS